uniref:hypothetical protein n=1 Tax=Alistipes finegoldii TaxID=214856 RepID=UPI00242F953D
LLERRGLAVGRRVVHRRACAGAGVDLPGRAEDEGKNPTEKTEKLRYEDISNRRSPSVGK